MLGEVFLVINTNRHATCLYIAAVRVTVSDHLTFFDDSQCELGQGCTIAPAAAADLFDVLPSAARLATPWAMAARRKS